jgi:glycosyltransferase involved in cell wall biosynthesis
VAEQSIHTASEPAVSVVCPFFNEEAIIEKSVKLMLANLDELPSTWELVLVNDGSLDNSWALAKELSKDYKNLRVVGYSTNQGRGYAIREGVKNARGKIVITTEIDSSWGDDIVSRILVAFQQHPDADIVIASPHLPGGGYKNVPFKRVLLSKYGNFFIRAGLTTAVTMNTGMTRGYRREKFLALPLDENGKEMHLEIVNKALAFHYKIYEVPAVLEWKDKQLSQEPSKKRSSSSKIKKLIRTHMLFSLGVAPFRYIFVASLILAIATVLVFFYACYRFLFQVTSIFMLYVSFFLGLFSFLFFIVGLLSQQNREILQELWHIRSSLAEHDRGGKDQGC